MDPVVSQWITIHKRAVLTEKSIVTNFFFVFAITVILNSCIVSSIPVHCSISVVRIFPCSKIAVLCVLLVVHVNGHNKVHAL